MNLREECVQSEVVFSGRLLRIERDVVSLPNGERSTREIVRHSGAVAIVALHEGNLLLVRQYRYALGAETLEIPAGRLEPGEDSLECAERELREETGYRGKMKLLGSCYSTPGFSDEKIFLYLATDLVWDPLKPDEDEFLQVESLPWHEAVHWAQNAQFNDAKTIVGILMLHGRGFKGTI